VSPEQYVFATSNLPEVFAQEGVATKGRLWGQYDPQRAMWHEKPAHRRMMTLRMQGMRVAEIARETGYCENLVSQLLRQPWAVAWMTEHVQDDLTIFKDKLRKQLNASLDTLVELRDDDNTPQAVRSANAKAIIEMFVGKPKQEVEHKQDVSQMTDEQLRELRRRTLLDADPEDLSDEDKEERASLADANSGEASPAPNADTGGVPC